MPKKVAVFFGGNSNEHEISIITGMLCANLLRGADFDVLPVYLSRENRLFTGRMRAVTDLAAPSPKWMELRLCVGGLEAVKGRKKFPVDVALNCCHGGCGEDGTLSALLKWYRIASASPDAALSAVFMDKTLSKAMARGLGLPVADGVTVREGERMEPPFPFPVIVKPARLGSSIGITVASNAEEYRRALALAFKLDDSALIEPYLQGKRDLNCAACRIGGEVKLSPVEEVFSREEILSFQEKYEGGEEKRSRLPADIPDAVAAKVKDCTRRIYEGFHAKGVVRADFLLVGEEVYFNELNTVPGSLSCYLFGGSLSEAKEFLVALIGEGMKADPPKPTVTTGILSSPVFTAKSPKRPYGI